DPAIVMDRRRCHRTRSNRPCDAREVSLGGPLCVVGAEDLEPEERVDVDDLSFPYAPWAAAIRPARDAPTDEPACPYSRPRAVTFIDGERMPARERVVAIGVVDVDRANARLAVP